MGIPSITTNLSGFGCYMEEMVEDTKTYGIYVVDRRNIGIEESVQQLAGYMFEFSRLKRQQRIIQRNRTERLSDLLDWKTLGIYYRQARVQALKKIFPDYEDNAPTMSESAFNRMTYPRPISEPPSPVSTRPSSPERISRPGSPGARSIYSMNSDDSASHDSEEELDALELDQN